MQKPRKKATPRRLAGLCIGLVAVIIYGAARNDFGFNDESVQLGQGRRLLSNDPWNPIHNEIGYEGPLGKVGMVLWVPFVMWLFLGVAVVADEYFTPALEKISKALDLSADVAGATFLAAASSAPEFFTSFADTFLVSDEGGGGFGIGTIVGSAVFNILIICAVSCIPTTDTIRRLSPSGVMLSHTDYMVQHSQSDWDASAKTEIVHKGMLHLDWYPLLRDSIFYVTSILVMILTLATDSPSREHQIPLKKQGCVHWYESLVYILVYAGYIVTMKYSHVLDVRAKMIVKNCWGTEEGSELPVAKSGWGVEPVGRKSYPKLMLGNSAFTAAMRVRKDAPTINGVEIKLDRKISETLTTGIQIESAEQGSEESGSEDEDDVSPFWETVFDIPSSGPALILWGFALPFNLLFKLTIPAVTRRNLRDRYVLAFFMSILWIAAFSAMMVKVVSWIGAILGIDSITMGLVVLAAGTSVPDALGSYNEAKRGEANAAVSNALGSNVFDICMGLGVPWFFYSIAYGRCFQIPTDNILIPTFLLFFVLALFLGTLGFSGMKLYPAVGKLFLGIYLLFVAWNLIAVFAL